MGGGTSNSAPECTEVGESLPLFQLKIVALSILLLQVASLNLEQLKVLGVLPPTNASQFYAI